MSDYYRCLNCRKTFSEPEQKKTTYESYFGVSSLFPTGNVMYVRCCPYCGSDDIEEEQFDYDCEDDEDELDEYGNY